MDNAYRSTTSQRSVTALRECWHTQQNRFLAGSGQHFAAGAAEIQCARRGARSRDPLPPVDEKLTKQQMAEGVAGQITVVAQALTAAAGK
jgi:hypothetical protein